MAMAQVSDVIFFRSVGNFFGGYNYLPDRKNNQSGWFSGGGTICIVLMK
jgi:hypothetical protein